MPLAVLRTEPGRGVGAPAGRTGGRAQTCSRAAAGDGDCRGRAKATPP